MEHLTPEQQRQLDRIQALLNKANAEGVTDKESESLTAKALELMTKYMIDRAYVDAKANSTDTIETRMSEVGRPYLQMMTLANTVYKHFGCQLVRFAGGDPDADILNRLSGKTARGTKYHDEKYAVTGFRSDLDAAQMLWLSLQTQAARRVSADYRREGVPVGERRSTYRRSWYSHFVNVIYERLAEIKRQQMADSDRERGMSNGTGAEVVLASRAQLVARVVAEKHSRLSKGRSMRAGSGSGGEAGAAAGRAADLGGRKIGTTQRALDR